MCSIALPSDEVWLIVRPSIGIFAAPYLNLERWQSGLMRWIANPLYGVNPYRGFESLPLRHRHAAC